MEKILSGLINKCCLVYVDDIPIFGNSIEGMIAILDAVLGRISHQGGSINLGKSKFLRQEIDFLGHTIGESGLTASNKDISAIREYKKPSLKKEILSFLGLAVVRGNKSPTSNLFHTSSQKGRL
jgi:Reverse transcriptase (RNA-dependent DNA polymerase)